MLAWSRIELKEDVHVWRKALNSSVKSHGALVGLKAIEEEHGGRMYWFGKERLTLLFMVE